MKRLFISKDGKQFNSEYECTQHEIDMRLTFKCDACQGLGYTQGKKLLKVRECRYHPWDDRETEVEVEREVDTTIPCRYCENGYRDKPLVPKYKIHREFIGYEDENIGNI